MIKNTWEKVFEYASMPVHGTLSRKLRKDVSLQINEGPVYQNAVIFLGEEFVRVTNDTWIGKDHQYLLRLGRHNLNPHGERKRITTLALIHRHSVRKNMQDIKDLLEGLR